MKQKSSSTARLPNKHKNSIVKIASTKQLEAYVVDKPHGKADERRKDRSSQQHVRPKNKTIIGVGLSKDHSKSCRKSVDR